MKRTLSQTPSTELLREPLAELLRCRHLRHRVLDNNYIGVYSVYMVNTRFRVSPHLEETLERKERSKRWLARKMGVSHGLLHFALKGERTVGTDAAMKAAVALAEPIEYLFVATDRDNLGTPEGTAA
jgi:hypothetical protein